MSYKIERKGKLIRPWYWELYNSAYGMCWGRAWTKKGAEKALLMEQGRWFAQ